MTPHCPPGPRRGSERHLVGGEGAPGESRPRWIQAQKASLPRLGESGQAASLKKNILFIILIVTPAPCGNLNSTPCRQYRAFPRGTSPFS